MYASPSGQADDAGLISLTYISECRIDAAELLGEIERLADSAQHFNDAHQVTGALLFTGRRFVQTLEGPPVVVDALFLEIKRDPRHSGVRVIDRRTIDTRVLERWTMGYAGPSVFVSRALENVLEPSHPNFPAAVTRLVKLVAEFARQSVPPSV